MGSFFFVLSFGLGRLRGLRFFLSNREGKGMIGDRNALTEGVLRRARSALASVDQTADFIVLGALCKAAVRGPYPSNPAGRKPPQRPILRHLISCCAERS